MLIWEDHVCNAKRVDQGDLSVAVDLELASKTVKVKLDRALFNIFGEIRNHQL